MDIMNVFNYIVAMLFMIIALAAAIPMLLLRMIGQLAMFVVDKVMMRNEDDPEEPESEESDVEEGEEP